MKLDSESVRQAFDRWIATTAAVVAEAGDKIVGELQRISSEANLLHQLFKPRGTHIGGGDFAAFHRGPKRAIDLMIRR